MGEWREEYKLERTIIDSNGKVENRVTHTFNGESLPEILDQLTYFLKGCSFTYVKELNYLGEED